MNFAAVRFAFAFRESKNCRAELINRRRKKIKVAAAQGQLQEDACIMESLLVFKRAVLTYFVLRAAKILGGGE